MSSNKIVCRCEDVAHQEIVDAIDDGYTTLEEIKRHLRCGMGPCQGRTCGRLIAKIISRKTGKPMNEIKPFTSRPPTTAIPLGIIGGKDE